MGSNDFGIGEEETMLRHAARRLLREEWPTTRLHREVAGQATPSRAPESVWDEALWQQMVDLGWTAIAVPERAGGAGLGTVAVAGVIEELGRAAVPSPLPSTLAATYVLSACGTKAADALLEEIASGTSVALALTDRRGSWAVDDCSVKVLDGPSGALATAGPTSRSNGADRGALVLDGTAWFVQDAMKCEKLLVKARGVSGIGLYVVDVRAQGVKIVPDAIVDLTRDQARVVLERVMVSPARVAASAGAGADVLSRAEPALLLLVAADIVGAAEWQLSTTVDYAKTRVQFERPIGAFQAVKHPLVDLMTMIDEARALVYRAARAIDLGLAEAEVLARMAKARASDVAAYGSGRSVQLHGGIGFTWEHAVHIYFKRQKHNEVLLGDGPYQRARLADLLIGKIGAGIEESA